MSEIHGTNGTYLEDIKLAPLELYKIDNGSIIKFGNVTAHYTKVCLLVVYLQLIKYSQFVKYIQKKFQKCTLNVMFEHLYYSTILYIAYKIYVYSLKEVIFFIFFIPYFCML